MVSVVSAVSSPLPVEVDLTHFLPCSDMDDSILLTRSMTTRTHLAPYSTEPSERRKSFDEACQKLEGYLQLHPGFPSPIIGSSVGGPSSASPRNGQAEEEELCCLPPLLNLVHPSRRLCRSIMVWTAWKPRRPSGDLTSCPQFYDPTFFSNSL